MLCISRCCVPLVVGLVRDQPPRCTPFRRDTYADANAKTPALSNSATLRFESSPAAAALHWRTAQSRNPPVTPHTTRAARGHELPNPLLKEQITRAPRPPRQRLQQRVQHRIAAAPRAPVYHPPAQSETVASHISSRRTRNPILPHIRPQTPNTVLSPYIPHDNSVVISPPPPPAQMKVGRSGQVRSAANPLYARLTAPAKASGREHVDPAIVLRESRHEIVG